MHQLRDYLLTDRVINVSLTLLFGNFFSRHDSGVMFGYDFVKDKVWWENVYNNLVHHYPVYDNYIVGVDDNNHAEAQTFNVSYRWRHTAQTVLGH